MRATFEFAIEEGLMARNPARKLILPATRKPCGRFLSMDEVRRLLAAATGREHLTLRLLLVGGLRPAELFALRTDDIQHRALRIDEAVKNLEREATGRRIGATKTDESDGVVSISADLEAGIRAWAETRPAGALLFPTEKGTTWHIGNYLKRVLKPLAASVGIADLTHQCLRRTCATHFKGDMKDRQSQMRHTDPATTMRHYQKTLTEAQ
jgi:integrase